MSAFAAAPAVTFKATVRGAKLRPNSKPVLACAATKRAAIVARIDEAEALRKYPVGGSVYKAEVCCNRGHISMGLMFKQGPDGRPEVSMIRPGGTAKGKLNIGDVCLAASFTHLAADSERAWGVAEQGWFDTADVDYDTGIANMTTNSTALHVIMDRSYVPKGGAAASYQPANSVSSYSPPSPSSSYSQPPPVSSQQSSYSSSQSSYSSSQSSYSPPPVPAGNAAGAAGSSAGGVISSTTPPPPTGREQTKSQKELDAEKEDVKAWAAKIAAEARQRQGGGY